MTDQPHWLRALGNTRDAVFVTNASQRIVAWNTAATRLLQYSEAEVLQRPCYQVIAGRGNGKPWCRANCLVSRGVLRGTLPSDFDLLTHTKSGDELWVSVAIIVLPRKHQALTVHLLRDITDQRRDHEMLEKILSALGIERASQDKTPDHVSPIRSAAPYVRSPDLLLTLTRREGQVLALLAEGLSSADIAARLDLSILTVRKHVQNALRKLGVHSKAQAVSFALRNGLL